MSAWIVSKGHIDAMVQSLMTEGLIDPGQADEVGALLWRENHHSINVRYGEDTETPEYKFRGIESPLDPAKIVHLTHCYHYQCMEWSGFDQQPGMQLVEALGRKIAADHGFVDPEGFNPDFDMPAGHLYTDAARKAGAKLPWGIENIEEAI